MNDEQIVELYMERSEKAISETYDKYSAYCNSISFSILRNLEDAEECVNDTFRKAWESIPPSKPSNLKAFLGKIARNISLNKLKHNNTQKRGAGQVDVLLSELEECISDKFSVENEIYGRQLSQSINAFLEGLTAEKRKVFVSRYWYTRSMKEISQQYGISEEKIKSILFRLRKQLKKHLEKEGIIYEE